MTGAFLIYLALSYVIGGFCTGWILVRLKTGKDIRDSGSGGVGARNTGRILGRPGFMITLIGDAAKGSLAVFIAQQADLNTAQTACCMAAVIAGHIYPIQLGFRGGRGIATALGALLVWQPLLLLYILLATPLFFLLRKGFVMAGLCAFLFLPAATYALLHDNRSTAAVSCATALIVLAHRKRIRTCFSRGETHGTA